MDWKSLGDEVAKLGLPLLGAILPIPGGAAIGTALASAIGSGSTKPEDILATLTASAEAVDKAKQFELQHQETLLKMNLDYDIAMRTSDSTDIAVVNTTMTAELTNAAAESWYQKAWRPANGFAVALGAFMSVLATCWLFYLALVDKDTNALSVIPQMASSVALILGVPGAAVGIAAWHRGVQKTIEAQNASK